MAVSKKGNSKRRTRQWLLLPIVIITIGLGWKYPVLGYSVPIVMLSGIIVSFFRGRYVCGNFCPRGSFLDRLMPAISRKSEIPAFFRNPGFRWTAFSLLMGFTMYRGFLNPTDFMHWGQVFWVMCLVTTAIAVVLAVTIHPRSWCAFCPMGTMQSAIGGNKEQLLIDAEACKSCRKCEKVCPFNLAIVEHKDAGILLNRDCLKCSECVMSCPTRALSWPVKTANIVAPGK